jgi:hypothetical protein
MLDLYSETELFSIHHWSKLAVFQMGVLLHEEYAI